MQDIAGPERKRLKVKSLCRNALATVFSIYVFMNLPMESDESESAIEELHS